MDKIYFGTKDYDGDAKVIEADMECITLELPLHVSLGTEDYETLPLAVTFCTEDLEKLVAQAKK